MKNGLHPFSDPQSPLYLGPSSGKGLAAPLAPVQRTRSASSPASPFDGVGPSAPGASASTSTAVLARASAPPTPSAILSARSARGCADRLVDFVGLAAPVAAASVASKQPAITGRRFSDALPAFAGILKAQGGPRLSKDTLAAIDRWVEEWSDMRLTSLNREQMGEYFARLSRCGFSKVELDREQSLLAFLYRTAERRGWAPKGTATQLFGKREVEGAQLG